MQKIVISCKGDFALSEEVCAFLYNRDYSGIARDNIDLVDVVESFGKSSWGDGCILKIVEIPDDVNWVVNRIGDREYVQEVLRRWY